MQPWQSRMHHSHGLAAAREFGTTAEGAASSERAPPPLRRRSGAPLWIRTTRANRHYVAERRRVQKPRRQSSRSLQDAWARGHWQRVWPACGAGHLWWGGGSPSGGWRRVSADAVRWTQQLHEPAGECGAGQAPCSCLPPRIRTAYAVRLLPRATPHHQPFIAIDEAYPLPPPSLALASSAVRYPSESPTVRDGDPRVTVEDGFCSRQHPTQTGIPVGHQR